MRNRGPQLAHVLTLTALASTAFAGAGDDFYACTWPAPSALYRIDWPTGAITPIGPIAGIETTDIALSPSGTLYACTIDKLYTLNPLLGTPTLVGPIGAASAVLGLDVSAAGTLYACTEFGDVLTLDPSSGAVTSSMATGIYAMGADIAWQDANTMYALLEGGIGTMLVKVDLSGGGNHAFLGPIAAGFDVWSLDFDGAGNLIAVTKSGDVYWIQNPSSSGAGTLIASTGQIYLAGLTSAIGGCPALVSYCTSGTTSNGCAAKITGSGTPSASAASGFTLTMSSAEPQKQGILFYGIDNSGFTPLPWGTGTSFLCVKPPVQRMGVQTTSGTIGTCTGSMAIDWNAFMATHPGALGTPLVAGQGVFAQGWFRDPPSAKTTSLSDAVSFLVCP